MQIGTEPTGTSRSTTRPSFFSKANASTWLGIIGLCLLFAALRWQNWNAPLIRDEGEYAYAAQLLKHGELPYEQAFLQKPPMVVYTYWLGDCLAPGVFWMPRLLAAAALAASTALLGYITRREFGADYAFPAMWLFTPMVLLPKLSQSTANTEMFLLLPLLGTFAVYVRDRQGKSGFQWWFLAGFLTALALLYKYTVFPLLTFLWFFWLVEKLKALPGWKAVYTFCAAGALGFALSAMVVLAPFLISDGGKHLWECTVRFNRAYTSTGIFSLDSLYIRLSSFWQFWRVLCILPLLLLVKEPPRIRFWLGACGAALLSTGASQLSQYYIPLTPFWAMICSVALVNFTSLVPRRFPRVEVWSRRLSIVVVLVTACLPDLPLIMPGAWQVSNSNSANPFSESLVVAKRVADLSRPGDPVFVAGSEPQILYYARRTSPTRFVIAYPYMIPTPFAEQYQSEAIADLQRHPPTLVVMATSNSSWLDQKGSPLVFRNFLQSMLAMDYERVGGYDSSSGQWLEPLPTNPNWDQVSLILFRRKATQANLAVIPREID